MANKETSAVPAPDFISASDFVSEEENFSVDDRPTQKAPTAIVSGWEAAEELTPRTEFTFPNEFKQSETPQIVKFIGDNGPFASFKQHFLVGKPGKKSYVCLNIKGNNDCPLCNVLHNKSEEKRAFTIVNFSADGGAERQVLIATPRLYKSLSNAQFSPQGPLTKPYWAMSRTGEKQTTVYHLQAIKSRDLQEDWGINEAEAEAMVSSVQPFEPSLYRENSYAELLEIAQEMMGN
jgi:hypothetical protein